MALGHASLGAALCLGAADARSLAWSVWGLSLQASALLLWRSRVASNVPAHTRWLLLLPIWVFPVWLCNHLQSDTTHPLYVAVEIACLLSFAYGLTRFTLAEMHALEVRAQSNGLTADCAMVSAALVAFAIPLGWSTLSHHLGTRDVTTLVAFAACLTCVFSSVCCGLLISLVRVSLGLRELLLLQGALALLLHFVLRLWTFTTASPTWTGLQSMAELVLVLCASLSMCIAEAPNAWMSRLQQTLPKVYRSCLYAAVALVFAVPLSALASHLLFEAQDVAPVWVWVGLSAVCTTIAIVRLLPVLEQTLLWQGRFHDLEMIDHLTLLPNRHALGALAQRLSGLLPQRDLAVVCVDLDDFKSVNDLYGLGIGDELLQAVGAALSRLAHGWPKPPSDEVHVLRLGADEFAMVWVSGVGGLTRQAVYELAQQAHSDLSRAWPLSSAKPVFARASVGFEITSTHSLMEGLRLAQRAMQEAKATHSGPSIERRAHPAEAPRQQVRQWTHQALSQATLPLDLQAIVCTSTFQIKGYEVLARLSHPDRPNERLYPGTFLEVVDSDDLHRVLLSRVLETLAQHRDALADCRLSVNVEPDLLVSRDGASWLHQQVISRQLRPQDLTLEILETRVGTDASLHQPMHWLTQQGYTLAMDDFGAGYSNLRRMSELPFTVLKVDSSVINAAAQGDGALLASIRNLGRSRGMRLVAEGVATAHQLLAVQQAGIELTQGFLHARPLPIGLVDAQESVRRRRLTPA